MTSLSIYRVELFRLLKDKITLYVMAITVLAPLAGFTVYRPLLSTSRTTYLTSTLGTYLANPALAGAIGGAAVFSLLVIIELDRVHRTGTAVLTDTIISPLLANIVRVIAVITIAIIAQIITIILYLPYTFIKSGSVFDIQLYMTLYLIFMLPAIIFSILFSASAYQITYRVDLSICFFIAFLVLSLTLWKEKYLLCWVNPAVWILSDDFGNTRLIRTVLYNRLFWCLLLLSLYLISYLCIRIYKKNILGSIKINIKKFYIPIMIVLLFSAGCYSYYAQPFLDHSLAVPLYKDNFTDELVCKSIYVEAMPDIKRGRYYAKTTFNVDNLTGTEKEAMFKINPGYKINSVTANGKSVYFEDKENDEENAKEIMVLLPEDKEIELVMAFGGIPREWNILESGQGLLEIGNNYLYLANEEFSPEPLFCLSSELYSYAEQPFKLTADITLPKKLTPVLFGKGTSKLIRENMDGTNSWKLSNDRCLIIVYAADFITQKVNTAGVNIEFYYSAKHKKIMEKAQVGKTLKQVFDYCSEHYGPLYCYSDDNKLKLIQVSAYQGGGYAGGGSSIMDENCFNERSLNDSLKGAGGSEVMAHEIIHQWWGLGYMFNSENLADEWSSEGLTVYTTYRLMKELYGDEYAKANYVDIWEEEVDNYFNNFYIRHPEYLKCLPKKYQDKVNMDLARVRQYCLMPLKILEAEKLVGGEEKMDEILSKLFTGERNPEYPYLDYKEFLNACGLSEEDLNLE